MRQMTYQEAFHFLRQTGWSAAQIDRLCRFRQRYQVSELDEPSLDRRHLEFVRWLVATGRLTDHIPEPKAPDVVLSKDAERVGAPRVFALPP